MKKDKANEIALITGVIVFNFADEVYKRVDCGYIEIVDLCKDIAYSFYKKFKVEYEGGRRHGFDWQSYIDEHFPSCCSWDELVIDFAAPLIDTWVLDSTRVTILPFKVGDVVEGVNAYGLPPGTKVVTLNKEEGKVLIKQCNPKSFIGDDMWGTDLGEYEFLIMSLPAGS
jgi:hypothetical protein